jgi:hypothetical protein
MMKPNATEAKKVLENALNNWMSKDRSDFVTAISRAVGLLRGYELPRSVLDKYQCSFCGVSGVKLWRGIGTADQAWCSKCGMAQAGYPDAIDYNGRHSCGEYGPSDQIYSPKQGQNLLPWVPTPDGETWGYSSVPPEGCEWWRALPTRVEQVAMARSSARVMSLLEQGTPLSDAMDQVLGEGTYAQIAENVAQSISVKDGVDGNETV